MDPFHHVFGDVRAELNALVAALPSPPAPIPDLALFATLPAVRTLLDRLESPELLAARAAAAGEYLLLLYVTAAYARGGYRIVSPDRDRLPPALDGPLPTTPPIIPGGACYVRLPERLVWAQVDPSAPHEPLDGVYVVSGPGTDELTLLAVLGLRPERDGFSQIAMTVRHAEIAGAATAVRPERFAPAMDGGRSAGFRSVVTQAELLIVAQLALLEASR